MLKLNVRDLTKQEFSLYSFFLLGNQESASKGVCGVCVCACMRGCVRACGRVCVFVGMFMWFMRTQICIMTWDDIGITRRR